MKNQKNSKKVAAGVLAAQIVLQAAAMNIPAFADDVQTDAQENAESTNADSVAVASADDTLTIANGTAVPEKLVEGKFVVVKGTVSSAVSNITKITVGVYDKDGNCVASGSVDVKEKTFDLSKLDDKISFNKLTTGDYYYKVIVSNASNSDYVLVNQSFTVTKTGENQTSTLPIPAVSEDKITISGNNTVPDTMKKGSSFSIQGTVTSEQSDLVYLTAGVYDSNGNFVTGRTIAPKAKTYDIRKLDSYISFNKLNEGKYIYAVIATNAENQNVALVNKQFTVTADGNAAPTVSDNMTVTNGTEIPDNIAKGKYLSIKGTITSENSNITSLTVGVYDANNKFVTGKTVNPDAKTYNLANLDNYVSFNALAEGTYTYAVIASNGANSNVTVVSKKFTVGSQTSVLDELKISNGTTVPQKLEKGKTVSVKGTVTSTISNITSLTVGIYENRQGGRIITEKTVIPNAKTYDLSMLDNDIAFNKLTDGTYAYVVIATNANNGNYTLTSQTFTVGDGGNQTTAQNCKISNGTKIPANLAVGKAVSVTGILTAPETITKVTAGVRKADSFGVGDWVTYGTATPNAKSYDLHNLDSAIAFNKLPAGNYVYCVEVTTASGVVISEDGAQQFTVGNGGGQTTAQNCKISNGTKIPANLAVGKAVSVTGILTAPETITKVTAGVRKADSFGVGDWVTYGTATPNAKSYDLHNLDSAIAFNKLPAGNYVYCVEVTTASGVVIPEDGAQHFTVGNVTTEDKMTVTNGTVIPSKLEKGKAVSVKGTITSASSNITELTVAVCDAKSGGFMTGRTITINSKSYDLSKLDAYVAFDKLPDGEYKYYVMASNAGNPNGVVVTETTFTVGNGTSSSDAMTVTNGTTVPATFTKGKTLSVKGTITSASSNITELTVGVYDANTGKLMTGKTITPNAKSYDLSKLDNYVAFDKLTDGSYTYCVIASNSTNKGVKVVESKFTIGNGSATATDDKLTISGGTTVPATLVKGKALNVKGTVTSANSNITALTVGVYDSNGKFVTGRTIAPNAKSYDLSKLDNYVAFNTLGDGTYTYAVIASNAGNNNYALVSQKFTIGNAGATATADKLTISGGTAVPDTLAKGKALNVTGTVTSASSNITALTVGVYDSNGKFVTGRTIAPNATTYDLRKLDAYVAFNTLSEGNYIYAVIASNASNTNYALVSKKFTVGNGGTSNTADALKITGGTSVPDTIAVGKAVNVTGTVTSASSNMTALTVGVYDTNGKFITGRTIAPNAKTYDLRKLDAYVSFNTLPAGNYIYAVIASNAANSNYALVSKKFTVGNGGTSANTTSTTDTLKVTSGTTVPSSLSKGRGVAVRGTVTSSSSNITSLTVGVYDSNGKLVTGNTIAPNATSYNLSRLDSSVRFDLLAAGTYTYRVIATNSGNNSATLVSQSFTVK